MGHENRLVFLVGAGRFELPAPCSQSRCATKLRHAPIKPGLHLRGQTRLKDQKMMSAGNDAEVVAAVLGPRFEGVAGDSGVFLAVADDFELAGIDAEHDEVFISS